MKAIMILLVVLLFMGCEFPQEYKSISFQSEEEFSIVGNIDGEHFESNAEEYSSFYVE